LNCLVDYIIVFGFLNMRYDIPLKELFHHAPQQLLQLLTGSQAVELLNAEYPSVKSRRPDLVARLTDGRIYHLELQTKNDNKMLWRMLEYYALIHAYYGIAPLQQVLYVGKTKPKFMTHYQSEHLRFDYQLVDIREIDCQVLLQSNSLEDNILSVLCRLDEPAKTLKTILNKINQLDDNARKDMLFILGELAGLRNLSPLLEQEKQHMAFSISLEHNIFAKEFCSQGEKLGLNKGEKIGEIKMLEKRFGTLPPKIKEKITTASLEQLEKWTDRLFEAQSLEDLFLE